MKKLEYCIAVALPIIAAIGLVAIALTTGCATNPTTGAKTIDPVKLNKVTSTVDPIAASVIRRAILNSPQHSAEIANYARALGSVCCRAVASGQFSPDSVFKAADAATQGMQVGVPPEIIDAKNGLLSLYNVLFDDALTVQIPNNGWPIAVLGAFCDSIDMALKDAGQPGVK